MEKKSFFSTKKLVLTAMLAAMTAAGSALRITVPIDIAGTTSFHLGNILCALSGILLGPWWGGLAAGMGSALYDMLNPMYISEAWITFLTKGAYSLAAGLVMCLGKKELTYRKAVLASLAGAVTYAIVYLAKTYFYNAMLLQGLSPAAALLTVGTQLPATIFNAVVAVACAPALAVAIRKGLQQSHISLD